jgi:predicted transcriptional regulator
MYADTNLSPEAYHIELKLLCTLTGHSIETVSAILDKWVAEGKVKRKIVKGATKYIMERK